MTVRERETERQKETERDREKERENTNWDGVWSLKPVTHIPQ